MYKRYNKPTFVNTAEAYSDIAFFGRNSLLIPYINIDLMPGNPIVEKQSSVDFSYYLFVNVNSIFIGSLNQEISLIYSKQKKSSLINYIGFGGFRNTEGTELKIECEDSVFLIPLTSKISKAPFTPLNTPNFKCNKEKQPVETFFSEDIPSELRDYIGEEFYYFRA